MRIPRADEVFGWRIPEPIPTTAPPIHEEFIQQGLANVQGAVLNIADTERRKDAMAQAKLEREAEIAREKAQNKAEREREAEERKAQAKLEQAEREKEHSRIQTEIINMRSAYADVASAVYADTSIPDDQKMTALDAKAQEIKSAVAERFTPDKQHLLEPVHAEAMFHAKQGLAKQREQEATDTARANGLESINALELQAERSPADRQTALAMFDSMDLYGYSEQEKAKLREAFVQTTASNEVIQRINKGDYKATLADLKSRDKYLPEMDPKTRDALIGKVQTDIEQEGRRIKMEQKAAAAERRQLARETVADLQDSVQAGMPVSAKEWIAAANLVSGDPALKRRFDKIKEIGTSDVYQQSLIAKDPLKFGAASLGIKISDLNINDPQVLAGQIEQRKQLAGKIRDMYGLKFAPILQDSEVKMLKGVMQSNAAAGTGMLNNLKKMVGADGMNGIAQQLAKDDTQAAMMVGYVAQGKTEIARSVGEGQKFIKDKVLKMPKEEELRTAFDDSMGKAMDGLPQIRNAHYQSFEAVYAQLAAQRGLTSGDKVDKKIAQEAFEKTVGTVARYKGKDVVLPEGYDETRFNNFMRTGLTEQYIEERGGVQGFTPKEAIKAIRDDARLYVTSTPNVYRVAYMHDGVEYDLATKDNRPFEILLPDPKLVKSAPWLRFYRE